MDYNRFIEKFRVVMKECGMKNTIQREYVIKTLFFAQKHLTTDEIIHIIREEYHASISIATLYRILSFLEDVAIVHSLNLDKHNAKVYELNLNAHHDHIVCTQCQEIVEFYDEGLEKLQVEIMNRHNHHLKSHHMILYGICENCQSKEKS